MKNRLALFLLAASATAAIGCYRQSLEEVVEEESAGMPSVYAALCRYWERCRPEQLEFFPNEDVSQCIAFYDCYYKNFPPVWPDIDDIEACEGFIDKASCDDLPEAVTPLPASGGMLLTQAAAAAAGLGLPAGLGPSEAFYLPSVGEALSSIAACESSWGGDDSEEQHETGEVCLVSSFSCGDELYCSVSEPYQLAGDSYCGVCAERAEVGEACGETTPCDWGLECDEGSCFALPALGDVCTEDSDCYYGSCLAGVCTQRGDVGATCDSDGDCISDNICGPDGSCIEEYVYIVLSEGEPCDLSSDDSVIGYCDASSALVCIDGYCEKMSDVGGPCATDFDCRLGLNCNGVTCEQYTCDAYAGERCGLRGPRCALGTYCDSEEQRCISYLQEGDLCEDNGRCDLGLRCSASVSGEPVVCAKPLSNGNACSLSSDCESGYCDRSDKECEILAGDWTVCDTPACEDCGVCMERPDVSVCE